MDMFTRPLPNRGEALVSSLVTRPLVLMAIPLTFLLAAVQIYGDRYLLTGQGFCSENLILTRLETGGSGSDTMPAESRNWEAVANASIIIILPSCLAHDGHCPDSYVMPET